ncbi:MAG: hypothetical protein ABJE95_08130 [Byssovorax sp.]
MRAQLDLITLALVATMAAACSSDPGTGTTSNGAGGGTTSGAGTTSGSASTGTGMGSSNVLASGLFHPVDLALFDSSVYWTQQGNGINKLAVAGGGMFASIVTDSDPKSLAVDATGIYWVTTATTPAIMHAGLDGSSPTSVLALDDFGGGKLRLAGGKLYFAATMGGMPGIYSAPTAGGAATLLHGGIGINGVHVADSSGVVWDELDGSDTVLMHAGLDGSGAAPIATLSIGSSQYFRGFSSDGASVYYGVRDQGPSPNVSYVYKAAIAGGAPAKVFTFTGEIDDCIGDAKGVYFGDNKYETAGVYLAGADGKTSTLIDSEPSGNVRQMAFDATHLVWMSGDDSGATQLHAITR